MLNGRPERISIYKTELNKFDLNFLDYLHEDTNSLRLLIVEILGSHIMKYFSHKQRLHRFEALLV